MAGDETHRAGTAAVGHDHEQTQLMALLYVNDIRELMSGSRVRLSPGLEEIAAANPSGYVDVGPAPVQMRHHLCSTAIGSTRFERHRSCATSCLCVFDGHCRSAVAMTYAGASASHQPAYQHPALTITLGGSTPRSRTAERVAHPASSPVRVLYGQPRAYDDSSGVKSWNDTAGFLNSKLPSTDTAAYASGSACKPYTSR